MHLVFDYEIYLLINVPIQMQFIENTSWKVLACGIYARVVDVSEIERVSAANEFFVVFWRSKGRGAMPQGHENKGNKTIRQKEKQKARVTYRVKRPPKWEGAPPYGASPPTSPGNRTPPPY